MAKTRPKLRVEVGVRELKNSLSHFIDLAQMGNEVIVTEHGKPVARLVPVSEDDSRLQKLIDAGIVTPAVDSSRPRPRGRLTATKSMSELIRQMRNE